jgi:hypothetical protein
MEIINFERDQYKKVGGRGNCPHCNSMSVFEPLGLPHYETRIDPQGGQSFNFIAQVTQCIGCKNFVMIVGTNRGPSNRPFILKSSAPLGQPRDEVDPAVPKFIAADFSEAIRCEWITAYKAAVTMCRRAIHAAAIDKGATATKKLVAQIDELATNQIITASLKAMAHEVRLTGNDGAHPGQDGLNEVTAQDAKDIIQFTEELFHHVYVMPAKLKARQTSLPASSAAPNS